MKFYHKDNHLKYFSLWNRPVENHKSQENTILEKGVNIESIRCLKGVIYFTKFAVKWYIENCNGEMLFFCWWQIPLLRDYYIAFQKAGVWLKEARI